ncbi:MULTISPECIES: hypothetical protein [unclassified Pseudomonas]|nr:MULTISPECIES: hypothetical protein [unclassified Pseudomonas]MDG9928278.1 hypothetical protein [Pseudomonas sp. GD04042]MDH0481158.1 hypothetical protein [Pseudomonas sp. GD04015]MDH0604494.1 hypothetical protein [Pseudomonas sp. GD03869]
MPERNDSAEQEAAAGGSPEAPARSCGGAGVCQLCADDKARPAAEVHRG